MLSRSLTPWLLWLGLHAVLFTFVGSLFLAFKASVNTAWDTWMYFASLMGHMPVFALGFALFCVPCVLLFQQKKALHIFFSCMMTLVIVGLFADYMLFAQYRFHANLAYLKMAMDPQVVPIDARVWLMMIAAVVGLFLFEYGLLHLFKRYHSRVMTTVFKVYSFITLCIMIGFHTSYAWAKAHDMHSIVAYQQYLPWFSGLSATGAIKKLGLLDRELLQKNREQRVNRLDDHGFVYPLKKIAFDPVAKPPHIFVIMIDTWRFDTFNAEITPHLSRWTEKGLHFPLHYSTGNRTWGGVSGFFYGLSANYWRRIEAKQTPPVFFDRLMDLDYQIGIYTSAHLESPSFINTIFKNVPGVRSGSRGHNPAERDRDLTESWLKWMDTVDTQKPIFSFLFYDAAHAMSFPKDYKHKFEPMVDYVNYMVLNNSTDVEPIMNRYKTSVHYVDSLIDGVFTKLKSKGLLENSVIIVTADHGEEWNDNKLNYWKHGSNFTDVQVKVPMVIMAPDQKDIPLKQGQMTSHVDMMPTLLEHYLGAKTDAKNYALGQNLFKPLKRDFVIAAGANYYALIEKKRIVVISNRGLYKVRDKRYRVIDQKINYIYLKDAMEQISRFN